jgi:hypothetical protein
VVDRGLEGLVGGLVLRHRPVPFRIDGSALSYLSVSASTVSTVEVISTKTNLSSLR